MPTSTPIVAPTIVYDIFKNDGMGGPVDYGTVVATVTGLTWTGPALAVNSDTTFGVRARDSANNIGESNIDAVARVILDATGTNISARPNSASAVAAMAKAGGTALVSWRYNADDHVGKPTAFKVYIAPASGPMQWTTPSITVPFRSGEVAFQATISGLADATEYTVGVLAFAGTIASTIPGTTTTVTGDSTPPASVTMLASNPG